MRICLALCALLLVGCRSIALQVDPGTWDVVRSTEGDEEWLAYSFRCRPFLECCFGQGKPPLVCGLTNARGQFIAAACVVLDEERGTQLWSAREGRRYQARFRLDNEGVEAMLKWTDATFVMEDGLIWRESLLFSEAVDIAGIKKLLDGKRSALRGNG